jgi:E3 SUMO-protein ligase RanBP2
MLRSKKDVDRHVEQLEAKIHSESERTLKAFTVAKLYYNVGEYESARKYLAKYIAIRDNSSQAYKLNGQVLEALHQRERALQSYKTALELDAGQKELVIKICELLVAGASDNLDGDRAT